MSKATRLIELYHGIYRNVKSIERLTACHVVKEKTGMEWSEEEKKVLYEIAEQFGSAQGGFDKLMSKKIGDAVTYEVRCSIGTWGRKKR